MSFLKKFYKCTEFICCLCLTVMVLSVSVAVVGRYLFHKTPAWSEELALLGMTWIGMLSASLAEFNDTHIRISTIDILEKYAWFRMFRQVIYTAAKIIFSLVLLYYGIRLTQSSWISVMGGIRISVGWKNIAAPLAGGCLLTVLLGKMIFKRTGGGENG